jgi:hypothetical protein
VVVEELRDGGPVLARQRPVFSEQFPAARQRLPGDVLAERRRRDGGVVLPALGGLDERFGPAEPAEPQAGEAERLRNASCRDAVPAEAATGGWGSSASSR